MGFFFKLGESMGLVGESVDNSYSLLYSVEHFEEVNKALVGMKLAAMERVSEEGETTIAGLDDPRLYRTSLGMSTLYVIEQHARSVAQRGTYFLHRLSVRHLNKQEITLPEVGQPYILLLIWLLGIPLDRAGFFVIKHDTHFGWFSLTQDGHESFARVPVRVIPRDKLEEVFSWLKDIRTRSEVEWVQRSS
jgi:hypothetical protein